MADAMIKARAQCTSLELSTSVRPVGAIRLWPRRIRAKRGCEPFWRPILLPVIRYELSLIPEAFEFVRAHFNVAENTPQSADFERTVAMNWN